MALLKPGGSLATLPIVTNNFIARLLATNITANRDYELPNQAGTFALLTDIPTVPTVGTAAALNTGTTQGTIPVIGAGNTLPASIIPAATVAISSLENISANTFLGRSSTAGAVQQLSAIQARTALGIDGANARTTLGFGTAVSVNTGATNGNVPLIGAGNTLAESVIPTLALSKIENINTARILGRVTTGAGAIEQLTAAQVRTALSLGSAATANTGTTAGTIPVIGAGGQLPPAIVPSSTPTDLSLSNLQNINTSRFLGRISAGSGGIQELDPTSARTILNLGSLATLNTVNLTNIQSITANRLLGRVTSNGTPQELSAASVRNILGLDTASARSTLGFGTVVSLNSGTLPGNVPVIQSNGQLSPSVLPPSSGGGGGTTFITTTLSKNLRTGDRNSYQSCQNTNLITLTFDNTTNQDFNNGDVIQIARHGSGGVNLTATGSVNLYAFGKGAAVKTHTILAENASVHVIKVGNNDFRLTGLIV